MKHAMHATVPSVLAPRPARAALSALIALLAAIALAGGGGCAARAPGELPLFPDLPAAEQQQLAQAGQELVRLRAELEQQQLADEATCRGAAPLAARICELAGRICQIADRHPADAALRGQCEDSRRSCARGERLLAERCVL